MNFFAVVFSIKGNPVFIASTLGMRFGFTVNGAVKAIVDSDGVPVCDYRYDAWGNLTESAVNDKKGRDTVHECDSALR